MSGVPRLLVVDDSEKIHRDFGRVLSARDSDAKAELDQLERALFGDDRAGSESSPSSYGRYDVDFACQGERALDMVRAAGGQGRPYSVVFMDVRMPFGWDGVETIERIWAEFPHIAAVICSAYSDYHWDEIVDRLGETDRLLFLSKPFEPIEVQQMALTLSRKWQLAQESRRYIETLESEVRLRTARLSSILAELEEKNERLEASTAELEYPARHDELTGLGNRTLFRDRIEHLILKLRLSRAPFAVLVLDADEFKQVNDLYGHHVGDAMLAAMVKRITAAVRESDTVARLGGDEFGVLLSDVSASDSAMVARKIAAAVEAPLFVEDLNEVLAPRLSMGIATYPEHGVDLDRLLRAADSAMYRAKGGQGTCVLADSRPTD
jgi:diguanylate cyclase